MKILCIYHNEETVFLDTDPYEELKEHEVTVASSYSEAKKMLLDQSRGTPPFDVVLSDISMPFSAEISEAGPVQLLGPYIDRELVRGFGIFIPDYFSDDSGFADMYHECCAFVATKTCWNVAGKRDWAKLLSLVERQFDDGGFGPA